MPLKITQRDWTHPTKTNSLSCYLLLVNISMQKSTISMHFLQRFWWPDQRSRQSDWMILFKVNVFRENMSLPYFYCSAKFNKNKKLILRKTGYRSNCRLNSLLVWLVRSHFHFDLVLSAFCLYVNQEMVLYHISNIEIFEKS